MGRRSGRKKTLRVKKMHLNGTGTDKFLAETLRGINKARKEDQKR
jgi:hypothetical protein